MTVHFFVNVARTLFSSTNDPLLIHLLCPLYFLHKIKWTLTPDMWHRGSVTESLFNQWVMTVFVVQPALHHWCLRHLWNMSSYSGNPFLNKSLTSLIVYVHQNQCQLFHISNGIIWLTNWITLVQQNSFRNINILLHLICLNFKKNHFI